MKRFLRGIAGLSKIRIPSIVALLLGFFLMPSAERLAGPRGPKGEQTDQQFVIREAAGLGGFLICLFAAAGLLHSLRNSTIKDSQSGKPAKSE